MNYELAKQLKDAGFPLVHMDSFCKATGCWLKDGIGRKEHVHCPTLEELIEACDDQIVLEKVPSHGLHPWTAGTFIDREGEIEKAHTAETALEAVARLWIAIHTTP